MHILDNTQELEYQQKMPSASTHLALLNTVGPFLLFSNVWSSVKILTRRPRSFARIQNGDQASNHTQSGAVPAIRIFLERAFRFLALVSGLKFAESMTIGRSKTFHKMFIFAVASVLHKCFRPYHWTLSLYFSLRATGLLLVRNKKLTDRSWPVALVRHPFCIFIVHCFHNYFLTHTADRVSQHYLQLWLQVLPKYKKLQTWLSEFSTKSCQTKYYRTDQCGSVRLAMLPSRMVVSLKRQLPLVAATFVLPVLLFKRSKIMHAPMVLLLDTLVKIVRSSIVLTALPFMLTEFPCLWGLATQQPSDKTHRAPFLHTVCVSIGSTYIFLLEPVNRLRMLVVYTYWRIAEVFMLHGVKDLSSSRDGATEQNVAMLLTGCTALLSSML